MTLYTFTSLRSVEKAKLELEQATYKRAVLDIEVDSTVLNDKRARQVSSSGKLIPYLIHVVVTISNGGNTHALLDLSGESLFVQQMLSGSGGTIMTRRVGEFRLVQADGESSNYRHLIRPGNKIRLHYLVDIETPGIYLAEFKASADQASIDTARHDVGETDAAVVNWKAQKFIYLPYDDERVNKALQPAAK